MRRKTSAPSSRRSRPRIPRVVHVGLGYRVKVHVATLSTIRELIEEEDFVDDGCWISSPGGEYAGQIYINAALSAARRRAVYWHEIDHAINDITAWDSARVMA